MQDKRPFRLIRNYLEVNTDKGNRNMDLSVLTPMDEPTNWVGSKEWHSGNGGSE